MIQSEVWRIFEPSKGYETRLKFARSRKKNHSAKVSAGKSRSPRKLLLPLLLHVLTTTCCTVNNCNNCDNSDSDNNGNRCAFLTVSLVPMASLLAASLDKLDRQATCNLELGEPLSLFL